MHFVRTLSASLLDLKAMLLSLRSSRCSRSRSAMLTDWSRGQVVLGGDIEAAYIEVQMAFSSESASAQDESLRLVCAYPKVIPTIIIHMIYNLVFISFPVYFAEVGASVRRRKRLCPRVDSETAAVHSLSLCHILFVRMPTLPLGKRSQIALWKHRAASSWCAPSLQLLRYAMLTTRTIAGSRTIPISTRDARALCRRCRATLCPLVPKTGGIGSILDGVVVTSTFPVPFRKRYLWRTCESC